MCQAVQEMCDDARAEGRTAGLAEGLQEQAMLTAQRMLQDPRFSPEDISRFSGLSLEDVLKLQKKIVRIGNAQILCRESEHFSILQYPR